MKGTVISVELLAIISMIVLIYGIFKKPSPPKNTDDLYANHDLIRADRISGMSEKEIVRNAQNRRYYIPKEVTQTYQAPHRSSDYTNRIIIENEELYKEDFYRFGPLNAQEWMEQGKYNLNPVELEILDLQFELKHNRSNMSYAEYLELSKELDEKIASIQYDFRETEAVKHWRKVHNREMQYRRK